MRPALRLLIQRTLLWTGIGLTLIGIFTLYQEPDFLVQLADQLWSCF
ncbi:MAG: hypothetical protein ACLGG8_09555 [Gammaproteobacteria bacterium]